MPAQAWLVRNAVRLQKEALQFTDERSKLEGELLNGIDVVKCNSWEVCVWVAPPAAPFVEESWQRRFLALDNLHASMPTTHCFSRESCRFTA